MGPDGGEIKQNINFQYLSSYPDEYVIYINDFNKRIEGVDECNYIEHHATFL